jgi:hypothetical protein
MGGKAALMGLTVPVKRPIDKTLLSMASVLTPFAPNAFKPNPSLAGIESDPRRQYNPGSSLTNPAQN